MKNEPILHFLKRINAVLFFQLSSFVIMFSIVGCDRGGVSAVDAVVEKIEKREVRDYLERWAGLNIRGKKIAEVAVSDSDIGLFPCSYRLGVDVDWKALGFDNVHLNQVRATAADNGDICIVYLGTPRVGVFIIIDEATRMTNDNIVFRSGRIAVYHLKG